MKQEQKGLAKIMMVAVAVLLLVGLPLFSACDCAPKPTSLGPPEQIDLLIVNADNDKASGDIVAERLGLMEALNIALEHNLPEKTAIIEPRISDNSRRHGDSDRQDQNYADATENYNDAINYDSDNPWPYVGLILIDVGTGDYETAVGYVEILAEVGLTQQAMDIFSLVSETAGEYKNCAVTLNNDGTSMAETAETVDIANDAIDLFDGSLAISVALDAAGVKDTPTAVVVVNRVSGGNSLIVLQARLGDFNDAMDTADETLEIIGKYQDVVGVAPESDVIASFYENQINYIDSTALPSDTKASLTSHLAEAADAIIAGDADTFSTSIGLYMDGLAAVDDPQLFAVSGGKPGGFCANSLYCKDLCNHHLVAGNPAAYGACFWACMACIIDGNTVSVAVPGGVQSKVIACLYENQINYIDRTALPSDTKASLTSHLAEAADAIRTGDVNTFSTSIGLYMDGLQAADPQLSTVGSDKPGGFCANSLYCKDLCDHHLVAGNPAAYGACFWACMACIIDGNTAYAVVPEDIIAQSEEIASFYENQINYIDSTALPADTKASLTSHLAEAADAITTGDADTFSTSMASYMDGLAAVDDPQLFAVSGGKPGGFCANSLYCKDLCNHHLVDGNPAAYGACFWACMACIIDGNTVSVAVPGGVQSEVLACLYENQISYIDRTALPSDTKASLSAHLAEAADAMRTGDVDTFSNSIELYMAELQAADPQLSTVGSDKPGGFCANSLYCKDLCDHHLVAGNPAAYGACFWACMACIIDGNTAYAVVPEDVVIVPEGIVSTVPDDITSSVLSNTAVVYALSGDYNTALEHADSSLTYNPESPVANNIMGASLTALGGEGNVKSALTYIEEAVTLEPGNVIYQGNLEVIQGAIDSEEYEGIELSYGI